MGTRKPPSEVRLQPNIFALGIRLPKGTKSEKQWRKRLAPIVATHGAAALEPVFSATFNSAITKKLYEAFVVYTGINDAELYADFICCLILLGEETFTACLADPNQLAARNIPRDEYHLAENFLAAWVDELFDAGESSGLEVDQIVEISESVDDRQKLKKRWPSLVRTEPFPSQTQHAPKDIFDVGFFIPDEPRSAAEWKKYVTPFVKSLGAENINRVFARAFKAAATKKMYKAYQSYTGQKDSFSDFVAALILLSQETYEEAVAHPEQLAEQDVPDDAIELAHGFLPALHAALKYGDVEPDFPLQLFTKND